MQEVLDVLIIGAGLSGIGMGCHLKRECPGKRFAILERRTAIGGTWDLFRYPGIRSDSDMLSFGYAFRPWQALRVLADGPSIRQYVNDTAREYHVDELVQFGLKVVSTNWSSSDSEWTVTALQEPGGEARVFKSRIVVTSTGYYDYDQGYLPEFPGTAQFKGLRIHPQHWPENLDYRGKQVVVIGSGATAVTLVPAMAEAVGHITMLQRSPGYIFSVPDFDRISAILQRFLPKSWVFGLARRRNILIQRWLYKAARRWPQQVRRWLLEGVRKRLPPDADMRDFTPRYMPWDERLCAVPNANLFKALRSGKASVVTDEIDTFTESGIRLKSGRELPADIVVTATGLRVQLLGGIAVSLDGHPGNPAQLMTYKATLVQDVPNMACILGYTNAPWTLKADLAAKYLCRVIRHMDATGDRVFVAHAPAGEMLEDTVLDDLGSGYVRRARDLLPRQGRNLPWRVLNNYERDTQLLLEEAVADGVLSFSPGAAQQAPVAPALAA